jgi:TolB-like protein
MIVKISCAVLLLLFNPWAAIGQPKGETGVRGEIVGQGGLKFPIAVSPLKNLGATADIGKLSEGIADTIVYDLDLSGWFKVLDRAAYIENPQKSGVALGTFDFKDWSTIGAEGLVKGGFTIQGTGRKTL